MRNSRESWRVHCVPFSSRCQGKCCRHIFAALVGRRHYRGQKAISFRRATLYHRPNFGIPPNVKKILTRYIVTWVLSIQNEPAQLYMDDPEPQAVTDAANAIDTLLATDPISKGTPLKEGLFSLVVPPLRVLFSVRELDRLVEVASVCRLKPPPTGPAPNGQGSPP